jgi:hypothetical protein
LIRVTDAVREAPDESVQVIVTDCPGASPARVSVNTDGLSTAVPSTAVMVSPAVRPAAAAGPPETTPLINAPPTGDGWAYLDRPEFAVLLTCTPRNAG